MISFRIGIGSGSIGRCQMIPSIQGMSPVSPHFSKLGKGWNLQSPTFIIGHMQMQLIQLIKGHDTYQFLNIFRFNKVPAYIQHESPVAKSRLIVYEN